MCKPSSIKDGYHCFPGLHVRLTYRPSNMSGIWLIGDLFVTLLGSQKVVRATVAERLSCSPHTKANRVQFTAGSLPDFCMWESEIFRFPRPSFRRSSKFTSITIIGSHLNLGKRRWVSAAVCTCVHRKLHSTKANGAGEICGQRLNIGHHEDGCSPAIAACLLMGQWQTHSTNMRRRVLRAALLLATDPFHVGRDSLSETLQEQALEIKNDFAAKYDFEKIEETFFWAKYFKERWRSGRGACVPPRRSRFDSRWIHSRVFARGNRDGRCRLPAVFIGGAPISPALSFQHISNLGRHFMSCPGMMGTHGSQPVIPSLGACRLALVPSCRHLKTVKMSPYLCRFLVEMLDACRKFLSGMKRLSNKVENAVSFPFINKRRLNSPLPRFENDFSNEDISFSYGKEETKANNSCGVQHYRTSWRSGGAAVCALAPPPQPDQGSISGEFVPGFSNVGIVLDDAACRRVFSGYSLSPTLAVQYRSILESNFMSCSGTTAPTGPSWKARHSEGVASPLVHPRGLAWRVGKLRLRLDMTEEVLWAIRCVCGRAESCWNIVLGDPAKKKISSAFRWAVNLPGSSMRADRLSKPMTRQTIMPVVREVCCSTTRLGLRCSPRDALGPPQTGVMIISPHNEAALITRHHTSPIYGSPHCSSLAPLQTQPPLFQR
ncbi:hypothetical protein PR048_011860 [Dryococelus australis]|uniref:Uncharacterized protein n=1 Tax=Dryococelus australis TaxID=614101 RepID=A0ABQ9HMV5_9NEOP|nr:hypothetical protein PR048_011860 [Dryococelus australis]